MADETKKYIVNIESNLKKYSEDAVTAKEDVDALKKANEELVATNKKLAAEGKTNSEQFKNNQILIEANKGAIKAASYEYNNATKSISNLTLAAKAQEGSYEQLYRIHSALQTSLKLEEGTMKRNADGSLIMTQKYIQLSKEVNNAKKGLDAFGKGIHDNRLNVGNYSEAIKGAIDKLSMIPGPLGRAASSGQTFVSTLAKIGPIGSIVAGAIMAMSAPLVAFFTKSEKGVELLQQKVAGVKASFAVLVGELIDSGDKMAEAFDKPDKKAKTFWTTIMTMISPAWIDVGVRMDAAATSAENYTKALQELEDQERAMIVPRAEANLAIKEARLLYADNTKSIEVRLSALKTALDIENKTSDAEIKHQQRVVEQIKVINEEKRKTGQLRDADDKKLQEAIAKEINLRTESAGKQVRAAKTYYTALAELRKDDIELAKLMAAGDFESMKIALKKEYDLTLANKELTNTQQLILKKQFEDAIQALDEEALKEFEAKENEKKEILKKNYIEQISFLNLNESDKQAIKVKYEAAVDAIDKTITDKRKELLRKNLSDDLKITEDLNKKKIEAEKKYQDEITKLKAAKDKTETDKTKAAADLKAGYDNEIKVIEEYNKQRITLINDLQEQLAEEELKGRGPSGADPEKIAAIQKQIEEEKKVIEEGNKQKLILYEKYRADLKSIQQPDKISYDNQIADLQKSLDAELNAIEINNTAKLKSIRDYEDQIEKIKADKTITEEVKINLISNIQTQIDKEKKIIEGGNTQRIELIKKYNSDVKALELKFSSNKDLYDKKKAELDKSLSEEIKLLTDTNNIKIELNKKYEADVLAIQQKKISGTEKQKQIEELTNNLTLQLNKIKQYEKEVDAINKQSVINQRNTLKQASDLQIKSIEDARSLKGGEMTAGELDQILKIKSDYLVQSSKLDIDYLTNKQIQLKANFDAEMEIYQEGSNKRIEAQKKYGEDKAEIDNQIAIESQNSLQEEIDLNYAADLKKRKLKEDDAKVAIDIRKAQAGENKKLMLQILDDEYNALTKSVDFNNLTTNQKKSIDAEYLAARKKMIADIANDDLNVYRLTADALGNLSNLVQSFADDRIKAIQKETDKEKNILIKKYEDQIANEKLTNAQRVELKKKLDSQLAVIDKQATDRMRKQEIAWKALAVASATINTYVAASQALRDPMLPTVLLKVLAMTSIIATGLMNVKNIVATKIPGGGDSGSASLPTSISGAASAPRATGTAAGSTVLTQTQLTQPQLNAIPQPQKMLTADDIALALSKIPAPVHVVTVEDINVRTSQVNKIAVRANI